MSMKMADGGDDEGPVYQKNYSISVIFKILIFQIKK